MEDNSEKLHTEEQTGATLSPEADNVKLAGLCLSTCEMLARYAYEATARQQQLNILAQQVTAESTRTLYTAFD
jgi:hypothetical protein